jgi:hypothetical protein
MPGVPSPLHTLQERPPRMNVCYMVHAMGEQQHLNPSPSHDLHSLTHLRGWLAQRRTKSALFTKPVAWTNLTGKFHSSVMTHMKDTAHIVMGSTYHSSWRWQGERLGGCRRGRVGGLHPEAAPLVLATISVWDHLAGRSFSQLTHHTITLRDVKARYAGGVPSTALE